jgi:hypothetical protein
MRISISGLSAIEHSHSPEPPPEAIPVSATNFLQPGDGQRWANQIGHLDYVTPDCAFDRQPPARVVCPYYATWPLG